MARDYAKFSPRFWTGDTGRKLRGHRSAQVLAAYLISAPGSTMSGIFYLPLPVVSHETGMDAEEVKAAMSLLSTIGFAMYDAEAELVWLPSMAAWQIDDELSENDKRSKGVRREVLAHGNHQFVMEFWRVYSRAFHLGPCPFEGPSKVLPRSLFTASEAHRSQEHDQEHDQEQEKLSPPAPARDPSAPAPNSVPRGTTSAAAAPTNTQQTSHGTSGEPGDDNGKASSLGQDPREGQAGDPPAGDSGNRASASPPSVAFRLTVEMLIATWGQAREEEFGGLAWASGHGVKSEKLRDVVEELRPHPEAIAQIDSDMRRFWRSVRHGEHDKAAEVARSNSFAFGCWWSEFGAGLGPIPDISAAARTASARAGPRQSPHEITRAAARRFLAREAAKDTAT